MDFMFVEASLFYGNRPARDEMFLTNKNSMANTYTQLHIQFVFAVQNRVSLNLTFMGGGIIPIHNQDCEKP